MAVRPKRPPLLLPLVPTLAGSIAVGLLVALASAFLLYAPHGPLAGTASVLHPGPAAGDQVALLLDDLSGRRVGRQGAEPLYVVTGRARWSAPPKGGWVLDGVLIDRRGRALQRRRAQVGPLSMLSSMPEATPPGHPGPGTPLPARGESRFLIRFSPQPAWEADVRLEVRRAD
jgi:hypothetical protein